MAPSACGKGVPCCSCWIIRKREVSETNNVYSTHVYSDVHIWCKSNDYFDKWYSGERLFDFAFLVGGGGVVLRVCVRISP